MAGSAIILGVDPGERNGLALCRHNPRYDPSTHRGFAVLDQAVLPLHDMLTKKLTTWISKSDVVVAESWRLFADYAMAFIGSPMPPSQCFGMVRREAKLQGKKLVTPSPSVKKIAIARQPEHLAAHIALSSEEHDKDSIHLAFWYALDRYFKERA